MLVLTRRPERGDESTIIISDSIEITVVEVHGDQVRSGVAAPSEVAVWRRELWDEKQAASEQANR